MKPTETKKKTKQRVKRGTNKDAVAHRKQIFVDEYLKNGGNSTQAYISAGYSAKTANSGAPRFLADVCIQALISEGKKRQLEISGLSVDRTLREIARLAYADIRKLYNEDGSLKKVQELDDDTAATVASIEVDEIGSGENVIGITRKLKQHSKTTALDQAMKFHGLYEKDNSQRQPVTVNVVKYGKD